MRYRMLLLFVLLASLLGGCAVRDLESQRQNAYQLYQQQDYGAAAQEFAELVEQIPRDADLWFRLGNSYTRSMQPQLAIAAYENALLRDPHFAAAWYNKGIVHMQQALKTFIDMQQYIGEEDATWSRGSAMQSGLLNLLGTPAADDVNAQ